jgi:pimeloyl-ACP methyl ester carboxylesterase
VNNRYTLEAAEKLGDFDKPVLLAWADHDKVFPRKLAERLEQVLPNARLETVENSRAFVPEDQPERLAELILDFVGKPAPKPSRQTA